MKNMLWVGILEQFPENYLVTANISKKEKEEITNYLMTNFNCLPIYIDY